MTAVPRNPRVSELRELFRHLNAFRAVFEETGLEDITTPDGNVWSIWDLEYLHDQLPRLRTRQQQAITLCLIHNMRERDAAVAMGVSETNPVMMYATLGLQRLLDMVDAGELVRFREQRLSRRELASLHQVSVVTLVSQVRGVVSVVSNECWVYPNPTPNPPVLMLRSARSISGFTPVSPLKLLFENLIGPIPRGSDLVHTSRIPPFSISCVNPYHAELIHSPAYKEHLRQMHEAYLIAKKRRIEALADEYIRSRKDVMS